MFEILNLIGWVAALGCALYLFREQRRLQQQIDTLQATVESARSAMNGTRSKPAVRRTMLDP